MIGTRVSFTSKMETFIHKNSRIVKNILRLLLYAAETVPHSYSLFMQQQNGLAKIVLQFRFSL